MITINGSRQNAKLIKEYLVNLATQNKLWLAVGTGQDSWDNSLPTVSSTTTRLVKEVLRVAIKETDIEIVDQQTNPEDDTITDSGTTVRILGNIVCPLKPLREYGLFIDATEEIDSGSLYAYNVHPKVILGQLNLYMKYIYINF